MNKAGEAEEKMTGGFHRVYALVDLDAVRENLQEMKRNLPSDTGVIGVVKADGYGHGAVPVAKAIAPEVSGYAVATAQEAMLLRRHGINQPVLILGPVHEDWYQALIMEEIRPVVFTRRAIWRFAEVAQKLGKRAVVHLALDTGMSRIGMMPDKASADMVQEAAELPGIVLEGIFTHFATADEEDKEKTKRQLKHYQDFLALLTERGVEIPITHCANSAGIIEGLGTEFSQVRAGIAMYGIYPSDEVDQKRVRLKPALSLKSCVTYVKTVEPGTEISYGGTYRAERSLRVATVPVGYGDGYPRALSGKGHVLIHGKHAPILGRICMDQMMVDVSRIEGVNEGDEVTLIGRDGGEMLSLNALASACGGFTYEMLCNLGKRIPRVYIAQGKVVGKQDYAKDCYTDFIEN